jgi:hypothetical protein
MGRKVKIRVNYTQDIVFMHRLEESIRADDKNSDDFKRYTGELILKLVAAFALSPAQRESFKWSEDHEASSV